MPNIIVMRKVLPFLILIISAIQGNSQILTGGYNSTGYFFHPSAPRAITTSKTLAQISTNRYQLDLGDIGGQGWYFQFDVDASNNLVNWSAQGATPAVPASGFMTTDNPGNIVFSVSPPPGSAPYLHSTYNNRYDPVSKTFYLHYGYAGGSTGETGYNRQIYEKLTLQPVPEITSVTPLSGTTGTQVTIRGSNFTEVNPSYNVRFGNSNSDSAVVVSDSVILAWVGSGASGRVLVSNNVSSDTFPGFVYTPVATPPTEPWQYIGNAGFSSNRAYEVNAGVDKNNVPYTAFIDSADRRARVMKYNGSEWVNVGGIASDGKCTGLKMSMDTTGNPVLLYADSSNSGLLEVKRFDGNNWIDLNMAAQFAVTSYNYTLATDRQNNVYVAYHYDTAVLIVQYNGSGWASMGYVSALWLSVSLAISKDNTPYLLYAGNSGYPYANQACVSKFSGNTWTPVGTRGFTSGVNGFYYPTIQLDTAGVPVVAVQEDDGFERLSVFTLNSDNWSANDSRQFNKSRTYSVTQAIGTDNKMTIGYIDHSYNTQGTVLCYNSARSKWDTLGSRGFIPCQSMEPTALQRDNSNNLLVTFSDITQGGRVSVMKLVTEFVWTGIQDNNWENSNNWSSGMVPSGTSNVLINAGDVVVINSQAKVNSILVNPGALLTITPGNTLTVLGP